MQAMTSRYRNRSGIVLRRDIGTGGDVILTVFTPQGKMRGVARNGVKGPRASRLGLFSHISMQIYERPNSSLPTITEIILEGVLVRLPEPSRYGFAHLLSELADALYQENDAVGQAGFELLSGGLRGIGLHQDPDRAALVCAWKLIAAAGLFPRLSRCMETGETKNLARFDAVAGGALASSTGRGLPVGEEAIVALRDLARQTVRENFEQELAPGTRGAIWRMLEAYCAAHVGELKAWEGLRLLRKAGASGTAALAEPEVGPDSNIVNDDVLLSDLEIDAARQSDQLPS